MDHFHSLSGVSTHGLEFKLPDQILDLKQIAFSSLFSFSVMLISKSNILALVSKKTVKVGLFGNGYNLEPEDYKQPVL